MKAMMDWLDHRTGVRGAVHAALYEHIPGGARWRYVWGSTLVFAFSVQMITGVALWMCYSPSGQTAWESVYHIQHELPGGWLLRGIHHFMAQAMVVLLALHLMQVIIDGAYRAPREINFWLGLVLMQIVLALSLTGYLLPWDEKGYWATSVATNLMGIVPVVGESLQRLVVGGSNYGHFTLTRFFALHAGVLPALLIGFLVLHIALFRRHGLHAKEPLRRGDGVFWPDQILKDAVACLAVLAVVLFLVVRPALFGERSLAEIAQSEHPGNYLGAELAAPADPASQYEAARPEWYFLFLFQFLKFFEGGEGSALSGETGELVGAVVVPACVMALLFLMPLVGRWKLGHGFNVLFTVVLLGGIAFLTGQAIWDDNQARWTERPPEEQAEKLAHWQASKSYLEAVEAAGAKAERTLELAEGLGIPSGGAIALLRADPLTQGPNLFVRGSCSSCHDWTAPTADEYGPDEQAIAAEEASAPNLYHFASREWLAGLFDADKIAGPAYFGNTTHNEGDMVGFVQGEWADISAEDQQKIIKALSAQARLPQQRELDQRDAAEIAAGVELIKGDAGCINCHKFADAGELGSAPDLTGYGSREWLIGMISDPSHEQYYGDNNDRMPAFVTSENDAENRLSRANRELIVDWLRGDWHRPAAAKRQTAEKPATNGDTPPEDADADHAAGLSDDQPSTDADVNTAGTTALAPDDAAPADAAPAKSSTQSPEPPQSETDADDAPSNETEASATDKPDAAAGPTDAASPAAKPADQEPSQ